MTARVNIESDAWADMRFAALARACGLADLEHALIRVAKIWSWQTANYTPDRPTYIVERELIDSVLGDAGADKLVRARLAEETPDGFRIRGSEGRIEWLWKLRRNSAAGGAATKRASRLAIHTASLQASHCNEDNKDRLIGYAARLGQVASHADSPLSSGDPLSLSGSLSLIALPQTRAIVAPSAALSPAQNQKRLLVNDAWDHARRAHDALRATVDTAAKAWWAMPTGDAGKLLVAVVDELLAATQNDPLAALAIVRERTAIAAAEAMRKRTLDWFTPTRFWKQFWTGAEMSARQASGKVVQPPAQRAARGPDPPMSTPEQRAGAAAELERLMRSDRDEDDEPLNDEGM